MKTHEFLVPVRWKQKNHGRTKWCVCFFLYCNTSWGRLINQSQSIQAESRLRRHPYPNLNQLAKTPNQVQSDSPLESIWKLKGPSGGEPKTHRERLNRHQLKFLIDWIYTTKSTTNGINQQIYSGMMAHRIGDIIPSLYTLEIHSANKIKKKMCDYLKSKEISFDYVQAPLLLRQRTTEPNIGKEASHSSTTSRRIEYRSQYLVNHHPDCVLLREILCYLLG